MLCHGDFVTSYRTFSLLSPIVTAHKKKVLEDGVSRLDHVGQVVFFFSFLFLFSGSHLENTLTLHGVQGAVSTLHPTPSASVTIQALGNTVNEIRKGSIHS